MTIKLAGDAYVLVSSITKKQYDLLKKHRPEALKVTDEDGNDVFSVGYAEGKPSVTCFGVTFGNSNAEDAANNPGALTATQIVPAGTQKVKEYIADTLGSVIAYIKVLEEKVPAAYEEVSGERASLIDSIVEA